MLLNIPNGHFKAIIMELFVGLIIIVCHLLIFNADACTTISDYKCDGRVFFL